METATAPSMTAPEYDGPGYDGTYLHAKLLVSDTNIRRAVCNLYLSGTTVNGSYSCRREIAGSIFDARSTGAADAASATRINVSSTPARIGGSQALTP
jgi:hypothetical protein